MTRILFFAIAAALLAVWHYDLDPLYYFLLTVACVLVESWEAILEERFERNRATERLADAYLQSVAHEAWRRR